jgi:alpha-L-fucosidase 2
VPSFALHGARRAIPGVILHAIRVLGLPSGYFNLNFAGTVVNATMRLSLYDAEATGNITTTRGALSFRCFVMSRYDIADVFVVEVNTVGDEVANWTWTAENATSTWADQDPSYVYNPAPQTSVMSGVTVTIQPHLSGMTHASGYAIKSPAPGYTVLYGALSAVQPDAAAYVVKQVRVGGSS